MQTTSAFTQALAMASRSSGMILTDRLITYKRSFKIMLGLILIMVFGNSGIRAQTYTYPTGNPEYDTTRQYQVPDGAQFATTDPTINLTMECLATNGYGQWAVTSSVGSFSYGTGQYWFINPDPMYDHGPGWYLLSNQIAQPSEKFVSGDPTHPGCQPPGIISGGHFNHSTFSIATCKATANLHGSVRFVGIDPGSGANQRVNFFIEGLNDERGTNTTPLSDQQIDITLQGMPNPEGNTQIVKGNIFSYTSASTNNGANHAVVPLSLIHI